MPMLLSLGRYRNGPSTRTKLSFLKNNKSYYIYIFFHAHEWKSGQLAEVGSFISPWGPRVKTQVIRIDQKDIYPLTCLDSSQIFFFIYFTSDLKIYFKDDQKFSIFQRQVHKWENIMLWPHTDKQVIIPKISLQNDFKN